LENRPRGLAGRAAAALQPSPRQPHLSPCNVSVTLTMLNADAMGASETRSDAALAAAGDAQAFERLYRTHVARIHSLVRRMLGGQDADEVTQDVFVRTWNKLHTFRGDSAFGTWLHRLAVNVVIEKRRTWAIQRD